MLEKNDVRRKNGRHDAGAMGKDLSKDAGKAKLAPKPRRPGIAIRNIRTPG